MTFDADVIIAGAGPAGSIAGYELACMGFSVLILEKSTFPRYKVCGAGLTHKILEEIPYPLDPVIETRIHSVHFTRELTEPFLRTSTEPMMYCTSREKLDAYMLEKAAEAGTKVIFGEHVTTAGQVAGYAEVQTRTRIYRSRLVIGADGASGVVARAAGLRRNMETGIAWEAEIETDPVMVKGVSATVCLDWGTLPGGYAWMFPKGDHLSFGVGGPANLARHMMPYLQQFLDTVVPSRSDGADYNIRSLKSWPIPVKRKKGEFHNGRILVAGDAAGLTDALTGEGIYYAVRSGKLAAKACSGYLQGSYTGLESYSEAVNRELMTELLEAVRIRDVFNAVPMTIHRLVRENDRVWRAFGKILRGERHYADVRGGFGKFRFLWRTATFLSYLCYRTKETIWTRRSSSPVQAGALGAPLPASSILKAGR